MAEFRQRPFHENMARNSLADERRRCASVYSSDYAAVPTKANSDESELLGQRFLASFTKGLPHDAFGNLQNEDDYIAFVNAINQQDASNFNEVARGLPDGTVALTERKPSAVPDKDISIKWRGWESPRAGHYFDLQGPDADAVGMPPAPAFGSEELTAEMAEVYALALLRDVSFADIASVANGGPAVTTSTGIDVGAVLQHLANLNWFSDNDAGMLSVQERRRRAARRVDHGSDFQVNNPPDDAPFSASDVFRGSGPGAKAGPYVSQFMLLGNKEELSGTNILNAYIGYGRQVIDQKLETLPPGEDYLVHWNAFVDVQNGANFGSDTNDAAAVLQNERRFITTPRDLAAYVRYDALYQAYLNACLYMLGKGAPTFSTQAPVRHPYGGHLGPGFPDKSPEDARQAFATFGGPHILSLVTEVATRCLKAVRRQKFNYHRRARPERIGALLTLRGTIDAVGDGNDVSGQIDGSAAAHIDNMLRGENLGDLLLMVSDHNNALIAAGKADPHLDFTNKPDAQWYSNTSKYLLPMAFAEGSPMHPSYGAGHATVAGGCVTMLKAFFNTTDANGDALPWPADIPPMEAVLTSDAQNPSQLARANNIADMTINGELNKLAANISIGRNMAGVHYYTDYYESLRMGERVATGILIEQMKQYNEPVEFSFESFDGDHVHILKNDHDYSEPRVFIQLAANAAGFRADTTLDEWWHRHTVDEKYSVPIADADLRTNRSPGIPA